MAMHHDSQSPRHDLVEIIGSAAVTLLERSPLGVITLRLHRQGLSLDLTHEEMVALRMVMEKVVDHVNARL